MFELHVVLFQLGDSFKELKKRFSNTKINFLKRNDRTRNPKAARNQLQQMEVLQDKLQVPPVQNQEPPWLLSDPDPGFSVFFKR